jgi:hypothetical protein
MRRVAAFVFVALLTGSSAHAAPFTWTISGIADSGHWDLNNLAGLTYVLRLTTDSAAPDQNGFNDFGQYFNLAAEISIDTLGTRTLGTFIFVEQFRDTSDRLRIRGPNGGTETVLQIPLGTLGDPDLLSVWGPVETLGVSGLTIKDPGIPNPPFELFDPDSGTSKITISTSIANVPEPAALTLLTLGLAVAAVRSRVRRR